MVAPGSSQPIPQPVPSPMVSRMGYGPVKFTVADALSMVERGILPEDSRVELLEGSLIYRDRFDLRGNQIAEDVKHGFVVAALARLSVRINNEQRELRTQSMLVCSESHAPVPDAVVLRGVLDDYNNRLPTAADALCVVEVADSSYERDCGEKLTSYARAGIAQYAIINLRNRTVEVYSEPHSSGKYSLQHIVAEIDQLKLRVGDAEFFEIPVSELLP